MSKGTKTNSFLNRTVPVKIWQLIVGAVAIAAASILLVVMADAVNGNNGQQGGTSRETNASVSGNGQSKTTSKSRKSKRGNLIKRVGDLSMVKTTSGKTIASWTLTDIDVAPKCVADSGQSEKQPENGHFVVLSFDVKTANASADIDKHLPLSLGSPGVWKYYLKDGTLWNGNPAGDYSESCLAPTETLPGTIGAGTRASGKVVFDLPSTDGILVFDESLSGGWEYSISGNGSN